MRRKWMTLLVVMITTMTTAQEAFKQYDGLKAQAERWATLRLWTGFLSAYTPQDEPLEAQAFACSAYPAPSEPTQHRVAIAPGHAIEIQSAQDQERHSANHVAPLEALALEDEHRDEAAQAGERASARIEEIALLAEHGDDAAQETGEQMEASTYTHGLSEDRHEEVATIEALREVRLVSRTVNRESAETAPHAAADASTDTAQ